MSTLGPRRGGVKTGGRTKGTPNKRTLDKIEAREAARKVITEALRPILDAHISSAKGIRQFVTRNKKTGKFEIVTSPERVAAALNSEDEDSGEFWTHAPNVPAASLLLGYALDKPKEQEQTINLRTDVEVTERLKRARARKG
jgi:hypothetical protein